ncbi:MAG: bifunctional riboflavin kinase/FAD synthetase [Myxococcota bacterium]
MQILAGSARITEPLGPFAVVIGNFDGVHLGHQSLIAEVKRRADADALPMLAYTFHPHPATVLSRTGGPQLIEPLEQRVERLAEAGFATTLIEPFSTEYAEITPEGFLSEILAHKLQARHVVVGENFRYGNRAAGDVALMRERGRALGFETAGMPMVVIDSEPASSTRVRQALREGDVALAGKLLGRAFAITGVVMRGDRRGSKMGYPTANVATYNELLPAVGVYAARVGGEFGGHPAVANIGYAPTFNRTELKVEVHLLDFEARPLYGKVFEIEFLEHIRGEQRFESVDGLVAQIHKDVDAARTILSGG